MALRKGKYGEHQGGRRNYINQMLVGKKLAPGGGILLASYKKNADRTVFFWTMSYYV